MCFRKNGQDRNGCPVPARWHPAPRRAELSFACGACPGQRCGAGRGGCHRAGRLLRRRTRAPEISGRSAADSQIHQHAEWLPGAAARRHSPNDRHRGWHGLHVGEGGVASARDRRERRAARAAGEPEVTSWRTDRFDRRNVAATPCRSLERLDERLELHAYGLVVSRDGGHLPANAEQFVDGHLRRPHRVLDRRRPGSTVPAFDDGSRTGPAWSGRLSSPTGTGYARLVPIRCHPA
jgi:hypothetical protein